MKVLDYKTLLALNESSIRAGRSQNLRSERVPSNPRLLYPLNAHMAHEWAGREDIRVCVVLSLRSGQTAWLDVSPDEFAAIPEIEVSELEWEAVACTGNPPRAP